MAQITRTDYAVREFDSLDLQTQQLVRAVLRHCQTGVDIHILNFADNLRRSDAIDTVAEKLVRNEPLVIHWSDWLNLVLVECLKPYHRESFEHLMRLRQILQQLKSLVDKYGLRGIPDYGNQDFIALRDSGFCLSANDWELLSYAFWYHDLGKLAYPVSFWNTPGKFTPEQIIELEAHARLFYNLGEMFHVPELVVGLSVLHHYPNKHYPHNGTVSRLQHLFQDKHFRCLLDFLVHCDIYEAASGKRGYRRHKFSHQETMVCLNKELGAVTGAFIPLLQAAWELFSCGGQVLCPAF